jgi:hypothetical protein
VARDRAEHLEPLHVEHYDKLYPTHLIPICVYVTNAQQSAF